MIDVAYEIDLIFNSFTQGTKNKLRIYPIDKTQENKQNKAKRSKTKQNRTTT